MYYILSYLGWNFRNVLYIRICVDICMYAGMLCTCK
uniref:Uncharacterized protein n=1 Tax=Anguilla anguilla TaxID=7936 RepID=A0A0E9TPS6_ANGAN